MRRLQLGAPGIYSLPPEPVRALTGARMDVCAFVGVAPRGPARPPLFRGVDWVEAPCREGASALPRSVAIPVESFDAYRRLFGGFEGPGLLPYAVASFFENGGVRAYVVRIVPEYPATVDPESFVARGTLTRLPRFSETGAMPPLSTEGGAVSVALRARTEGAWGNGLTATLTFSTQPLQFWPGSLTDIIIPQDLELPAGTLLRITLPGGLKILRFVEGIRDVWDPGEPTQVRHADLSLALPSPLDSTSSIEIVSGALALDDGDGRTELHERLGLSSSHPRWLARVLYEESILAYPLQTWLDADLAVEPGLPAYGTGRFTGGRDDFRTIRADDFFDETWTPGDDCPGAGIHALTQLDDLASIAVPDLYSPNPLPEGGAFDMGELRCGPTFERALPHPPPAPPEPPPQDLDGLRLDPRADLAAIIALQQRVVDLTEELQRVVALLDVPPRLEQRAILRWRGAFATSYAAAYHPWLRVSRTDDQREALVNVPPTGVAAGIIAQREIALGIPHGPANVIAAGVVDVVDAVSPARHDELHQAAVNVYLKERDGVRLTAARTLGRDPSYRQLSVRRLMTMLKRTLDQQMQWAVFEPNGESLRADLRRMLRGFLRELWRSNAFAGSTEEEAYFVRCDATLNPRWVMDAGQLIAEVGVAPAEPLEFIVLRIERAGDGTLRVEG